MVNEDEIKKIEEEIAQLEAMDKSLGGTGIDLGSPQSPDKETIFKFFREILQTEDSTKVANVSTEELAKERVYQQLALFSESQGLDLVADYLNLKGEIIASTSMGKKGFLAQLFVTQIRKQQSLNKADTPMSGQTKKWWQFKDTPKEQEE